MRAFAVVGALTLAACNTLGAVPARDAGPSGPDAPSLDAAAAPDAASVDAFVAGAETRSLTIGPFHVEVGVEQTLCVSLDLGNASPMMLRAVRTHVTDGSHHLVVSRVDGTSPAPTPTPCAPLTHGIGQAIFIAESHESGITYPDRTGLRMDAHQIVGLELHMIDVTPDALDIAGTVDFDLVPIDPALREVRILFEGDFSLGLPPHVDTVATSYFPMTPGTEILALTTHTHQLGIDATLDVTTSESDPGTRVHESLDWSDPPLTLFSPSLVMGPADQLRLTCTFRNTTDRYVGFGTGFDDEMCFFWAYYLDPL